MQISGHDELLKSHKLRVSVLLNEVSKCKKQHLKKKNIKISVTDGAVGKKHK